MPTQAALEGLNMEYTEEQEMEKEEEELSTFEKEHEEFEEYQ